jgi:hypothetical protein
MRAHGRARMRPQLENASRCVMRHTDWDPPSGIPSRFPWPQPASVQDEVPGTPLASRADRGVPIELSRICWKEWGSALARRADCRTVRRMSLRIIRGSRCPVPHGTTCVRPAPLFPTSLGASAATTLETTGVGRRSRRLGARSCCSWPLPVPGLRF